MASQKYVNGAEEAALLIEAAGLAGIPAAAEWVKAQLDAAGVKVKLKGEKAEYVGFSRPVFDKIAIAISTYDLEHNGSDLSEDEIAEISQGTYRDDVCSGDNPVAAVPADASQQDLDFIDSLLEAANDPAPQPELPAVVPEPERVFDMSRAIVSEDGEVLNEEDCWVIAGMVQPKPEDLRPEVIAERVARCIRHLQREVDDIAAGAAAAIDKRTAALRKIEQTYEPLIRQIYQPLLAKRSKNYKDISRGFGVFFKKTGGWKIVDREELAYWLENQSDDVKAQVKATYKINFRAHDIYAHADTLKPPGLVRTPPDDYGQVRIGASDGRSGWSPTKAKQKISAAMKALGSSIEGDDVDDEAI